MTPQVWFILDDGDWTKVPLETEKCLVEDVDDLKKEIQVVSRIDHAHSKIALKAAKIIKNYKDNKENREFLKNQAIEIRGKDSLALVLINAGVYGAKNLIDSDFNIDYAAARKSFAENIWLIAELPAHNRPTLASEDEPSPKKLRLEDTSFLLRALDWLFNPRPRILALPPIPKTQFVKSEGTATIYAGSNVPIGTDEFEIIVTMGFSFVDKTLLIEDFIKSSTLVSLVIRPRRFGKTTNLTMLKNFFSIPIHPDNENHRRELFRGSKIETQKQELFESHFCKYPVIFISLKDFQGCDTWEMMEQKLRMIIVDIYEDHRYLYDNLSRTEKNRFDNISDTTQDHAAITASLKYLSLYLRKYHCREWIVLIDEYDHPFEVAFHNGYYEKARGFFCSLLGGLLKSNGLNIQQALLVGITRVAKAGYLSDLNNVMVYSMFDSQFADKFGFTTDEVEILLKHHQCGEEMNKIKEWYDGYRTSDGLHLYNPWSILSFISKRTLGAHWVNTGGVTESITRLLWRSTIGFKDKVAKLLAGEDIHPAIHADIRYNLLRRRNDEALWTLLYYAGYLTTGNSSNTLRIPNLEVKKEWHEWVWMDVVDALPSDPVSPISTLLEGNVNKFTEELRTTIMQSTSFHDVGGSKSGKKAESFYHGFVLCLAVVAHRDGFIVRSNGEGGLGRSDLQIEDKPEKQKPNAAILEFKVVKKGKSIERAAKEGLKQINTRLYRMAVAEHINQVIECGIAFEGKKVEVKSAIYRRKDGKWVCDEEASEGEEVNEGVANESDEDANESDEEANS